MTFSQHVEFRSLPWDSDETSRSPRLTRLPTNMLELPTRWGLHILITLEL